MTAAALLVAPVLLLAADWAVVGVGRQITVGQATLPAVAVEQGGDPLGNRLLLLRPSDRVVDFVLVGQEPGELLRDLDRNNDVDESPLVTAVAEIVGGRGQGSLDAAGLASLGIGFVQAAAPVESPLARRLDSAGGLSRLGASQGGILWKVQPLPGAAGVAGGTAPSRVRLVDGAGALLGVVPTSGPHAAVDTSLPAGAAGRRVVVAEPAEWAGQAVVSFDGQVLAPLAGETPADVCRARPRRGPPDRPRRRGPVVAARAGRAPRPRRLPRRPLRQPSFEEARMIRLSGPARATAVGLAAAALAFGAARSTASVQLAAPHEVAGLPESSDVLVEDATLVCPGQQRVGGESLRDVAGTVTVASAAAPLAALPQSLTRPPAVRARSPCRPVARPPPSSTGRPARSSAAPRSRAPPPTRSSWPAPAPSRRASSAPRRGSTAATTTAGSSSRPVRSRRRTSGSSAAAADPRAPSASSSATRAPTPSRVSLDLYGSKGAVAADQARGLSVPPRGRIVLSLDALAPGEVSPAVHVIATGGVVSAVLDDAWIEGATGRGIDDATRSASPGTDLIVPGVDVNGVTGLRLVNPGSAEAARPGAGPHGHRTEPADRAARRARARGVDHGPPARPAGRWRRLPPRLRPAGDGRCLRRATGRDRRGPDERLRLGAGDIGGPVDGRPAPARPRGRGCHDLVAALGGLAAAQVTVTLGTGDAATSKVVAVPADSTVTVPVGAATSLWLRVDSGEVHAAATVSGVDGGAPFFSVAAITGAPVSALAIPVRQVRR